MHRITLFEVISYLLLLKKGSQSDAERQDSETIVNIKNTCAGIKPEILPELFSKYVTNFDGRTGVGLCISKNIVEAHGGKNPNPNG